jgi:putative hydrolase
MKNILDVHCHTLASGHAYSTIYEYVKEAREKKLELIALTEHGPTVPGSCDKFYFGNLRSLPNNFGDLEVLYGCEVNIIDHDGTLDLPIELLNNLDIVIASLHSVCIEPKTDNTEVIIKVMNNNSVNIFGHLGDPKFLFDVSEVINEAKKTNTIIEINNSSLSPMNSRYGGTEVIRKIIKECKNKSVPIVLNSDAHFHLDVARVDTAMQLIKLEKFPEELILNTSVKLFKNVLSLKNNN